MLRRQDEEDIDPEKNPVLRLVRRLVPVTGTLPRPALLRSPERRARWMATPLFLVLLLVETTDLVFALDSIPAIFAVTDDPFIVYTSNVFAILGPAGALLPARRRHRASAT